MKLDTNSAVPLYEQLKKDILSRIQNNEFRTGSALPTEAALCKEYNVSRITVRNAISDLVENDILIRKQGKGTFVAVPKLQEDVSQKVGFSVLCQLNGVASKTRVIEFNLKNALPRDIKELNIKPSENVIYLKRVFYADNEPVMLEHNYFPIKYAAILSEDIENKSLYTVLTQKYNIDDIQKNRLKTIRTIELSIASKEEAEILNSKENTPLFLVRELVALQNGEPLHRTKQLLLGDKFRFAIK